MLIKKVYSGNLPPEPGFEYLLAIIRFEYLKGPTPDTQHRLSQVEFTAVSSDGKDYDKSVALGPAPRLSAELYPGASHEGSIAFLVMQNDDKPLVTFGRDYRNQGRGGVWWKLFK